MKVRLFVLLPLLFLLCVLNLKAAADQIPSGTWRAGAVLSTPRTGATATLMNDGRVLIVGGKDGSGNALATADVLQTDGTIVTTPPMLTARYGHSAILLQDGRVFVAGGYASGGAVLNSAELFDPNTNTWVPVPSSMVEPRAQFTLSQLKGGDLLLVGGVRETGPTSSIERFISATGTFQYQTYLTTARKSHSASVLHDGRVLISGGSSVANDGSTIALASTELYDPTTNAVSPGPALNIARSSHSSTTLVDGTVLVAGGNNGTADLSSLEIFDPAANTLTVASAHLATARSGHVALLLPNNNSVLITGGTLSSTPLSSSELYQSWNSTVVTTSAMNSAREGAAASVLQTDGAVVVVGGSNLDSTEFYGFPTVKTDASDYPPGSTVHIFGSGWIPGETVSLTLLESPLIDTHGPYSAIADANGNISNDSYATDEHDLNVSFGLTAAGSKAQAFNWFTDSNPQVFTVGAQTPNPVVVGSSATYAVSLTFNGNANACSFDFAVSGLPVGASGVFSPASATSTGNTVNATLTIATTAGLTPNTYPFTASITNTSAGCQGSHPSATANLVVRAKTATTTTITNTGALATATVVGQVYPVTYSVAAGSGTPTGTVTVSDGLVSCVASVSAGTCNLASTSSGAKNITATYSGDANFATSTSSGTSHLVNAASTTTALTSSLNPSVSGQSVTFTATVTVTSPGVGPVAPGSIVSFKDGSATLGTGTTDSSGVATYSTTTLTDGNHSITAVYSGNTNFTTSTSSAVAQLVKGNAVFSSLVPPSAAITYGQASISISGQVANATKTVFAAGGETVTVTINGTSLPMTIVGSSGSFSGTFDTHTIPVSGSPYTISYSYPGDANLTASTDTSTKLTISKATLTVTANDLNTVYGAAVPAYTSTITGFVNGESQSLVTGSASLSTSPATPMNAGTYTITAATGTLAAANYSFSFVNGTLTINKAVASVTPNAASKTYGTADPALSGTLSGFVAADSVTATYSRAAGETVAGGPYSISAVLSPAAVLSNYTITYNTAEFTINKAVASVTPNATSKTYGTTDPALTGTLTGFLAADGVTATYSRAAGETVAGGPYTISAALSPVAVLSNYTITYNTAEFTINKAVASVTANAANKTYGTADPALSGTLTGFLAADGVTATYSRAAGETVAGGPYSISAVLSPASVLSNYTITYNTAEFTINKAVASVTPNAASKTYGTTDPALTGTLTGFLAADGVTATYSRTAGETVAGGPYTITAVLSPAGVLGNYTITYNTAAFTINKAVASVTPNAATKTYGTADPALTGALTGFLASDSVTATYSRAAGETVAGGPYTISAVLSPASVLGNYTITYNTAAFTINKAVASVTPNAASKTYGTADPTLTGTLTGFLAADGVTATYSRTAGETVAGGPYTISAVLSPASVLGNYTITYNTAAFTINKAVASVTPNAASKTYGTADPTLTGTLTGFLAADGVTAIYSRAAGETVAGGPYTISAVLSPATVLGNYAITYNTAEFIINKAVASVTPNAASKTYGTADPTLTGTLTGFLAADGVTATYSRTAGETVAGGPYTITAVLSPAGVLGNYNITYNTAAFTINKAVASVTPNAASKTYGTADPPLTGTLTGFLAADGVTATYSRAAGETVAGGPYTITAVLSPATVLGNYAITYNTAEFIINKAVASVTPNAASKTYGTADPTLTGTLTGFLAADGVTAVYSRGAGETVAGGPYTISTVLSPAGVLSNYTITYNTAAFIINKAVASVTPNSASKTYGTADPTLTGTLTGFLAADGVTATYSRAAGETVAGGPYNISAALSPASVLSNYSITYNTAAFIINKAVASVTPNSASKTYGTADPALSGTLTGFLAADGVTAVYSRAAGESVAGGPYTISAVLSPAGVLGNYTITYNTGAFIINKALASVTPNAAGKTYGMADPILTGTLTGFLAGDGVTATYSRAPGETVAGGPYTISAALSPAAVLSNYTITYNTAEFTINKAAASVTPNAESKTYGTADPVLTGTLTGFLAADGVTAIYSRGAGETVAGGPYTISTVLSPAGVLSNYTITYNTAAFTINKAVASVTPNSASKTYGTTDPTLTGTLTGFLASDGVTAVYSRAAGETVAGGPYIISATLSPAGVLSNYAITSNTAEFTINKAVASVTPNTASKTYGTADPALTGTLTGFLASDGVTATYSRAAGESVAGGPYTISAVLSPASVLGNYSITSNTADFTINKALASVVPNAGSKTYGTADPTLTGTLTGFLAADGVTATYSRATGETVAGGPYTISASLSPAAVLGNYNITYGTAEFAINKAVALVTPNAASKTYGTADPALTGTLTGFLAADCVTATYTRAAGETVAGGPYTISAVLNPAAVLDNYTITYNTAAFTINKRILTVTATAANKTYDGTTSASVTLSDNRVEGNLLTEAWASATFSDQNAGSGKTVTVTGISISGVDVGNYDLGNTTASTTADITPRAIEVTGVSDSKTYDATTTSSKSPSITAGSLATGDNATYSQVFDSKKVGIRSLLPSIVIADGNSGHNYSVVFHNASGTISPLTIAGSITASDKTYDGTNTASIATRTLSGILSNDAVNYTGGTATFSDSNAGVGKTVTAVGLYLSGVDAGNYAVNSTATTTATIAKANQQISWSAPAPIVFGTSLSNTQLNATVTGVQGGTAPGALTYTPAAGTVLGVGTRQLRVDAASTINYNAATATVSINVNYSTGACLGDLGHSILQPINADGSSTFKQGSTVPAKFRVCDSTGHSIGASGVVTSFNLVQIIGGTVTTTVEEAVTSTTPDTSFRWDPTAQQWVFNISTKPLSIQKTYVYSIGLNDGSTILFQYGLPK
ncbi:MBG domain-containing protein [Terriglobus albidus]|uniref:MBG domain-containing protein n=1 Tax=Terriglobus albidus TaxID=1592106 RepID=UPI0021E0DEFD|nr:MBG domain-containing protein [Terriglobus albidus]